MFANKTVADAKEFSNQGFTYKAGVLDFNDCILCQSVMDHGRTKTSELR